MERTYTIKVELFNDEREDEIVTSLFEKLAETVDEGSIPQPGHKSLVELRDVLTDVLQADASVEVREGIEEAPSRYVFSLARDIEAPHQMAGKQGDLFFVGTKDEFRRVLEGRDWINPDLLTAMPYTNTTATQLLEDN